MSFFTLVFRNSNSVPKIKMTATIYFLKYSSFLNLHYLFKLFLKMHCVYYFFTADPSFYVIIVIMVEYHQLLLEAYGFNTSYTVVWMGLHP